ncbi:divergent PAP2 family protein [Candidatus Falkowbacteria bacterium]|nr:divergent PAP2 family protein [Candidatus Falkowbacteria bacterium]
MNLDVLKYIAVPIVAGLITQLIKVLIDLMKDKFTWESFVRHGGMPSFHSAATVAITTKVGLVLGFDSLLFTVCLIFTFIIMRDAIGFRSYLGEFGRAINNLYNKKVVKEELGHAFGQIAVGGLVGILVAMIL